MRAKERLTGAIILVVLIVLVVPEMLTGPRQADTKPGDGATDEGAPLRSYTIELGERSAKPARPLANRAVEPEGQPARQTAPPPASAAPETEPPQARTPPESGWSVQVGSFANRENADRLTGELRRLGFRSFVTEGKNAGRTLYRVRVGPEADRATTQALAERLRRAGHPGAIVPHP